MASERRRFFRRLRPPIRRPLAQPLGNTFQVNTQTLGFQFFARVAAADDGSFLIVWESPTAAGLGVFGQRYDAAGAPVGQEFQVNLSPLPARELDPEIAADSSGNFVVVWAGNPGVARKFFTTDPPCPQSASRLEVDLVNGGADLLLTWTDAVNTQDHIVFEDSLPNGPFTTQTGGTVTGAVGLTTPVPPGTTFFRVAGRNTACGVGPLN